MGSRVINAWNRACVWKCDWMQILHYREMHEVEGIEEERKVHHSVSRKICDVMGLRGRAVRRRRVTTQIFGNTKKYKNDRHQNQDDKQNGRVDKNNPSDTKKNAVPYSCAKSRRDHGQTRILIASKHAPSRSIKWRRQRMCVFCLILLGNKKNVRNEGNKC